MSKFQLKLADRQCRMSEMSSRVQALVVMLCASLYGARQQDPLIQQAADVLCQDLSRTLDGTRPTNDYFRTVTDLGRNIAAGGFKSINGLKPDEIMMSYTSG
jgi:hypothetical protein